MTFLTARTSSTGSQSGSAAAPLSITISPTVDLAASASAAINTATSTPLLLVRGESTYSETSFACRPSLKMTPLHGNWADEPSAWETPCSPTPAVVVRTASFESANAFDEAEEAEQVTLSPMAPSSEGNNTAVFEMDVEDVSAAASATEMPHVYSAFRFNPYSMTYATTELPHCHCLDCASQLCKPKSPPAKAIETPVAQVINPYATSVDEPMQALQQQQRYASEPMAPYDLSYAVEHPQQPQYQQQQQQSEEMMMEEQQWAEEEPMQPAVVVMRFVVPPPPPRIVRRVMSESVDGDLPGAAECVDRMYYNALMRWYNKVAEQQLSYFGAENTADYCPAPASDVYGFDEWAMLAGKWWLQYFEHAQKKTTATVMPAPAAPSQLQSAFQSRQQKAAERQQQAANANCGKRVSAPSFSGHRGSGGFACHSTPQQQQQQQAGMPAPRSWRGQPQQQEAAW